MDEVQLVPVQSSLKSLARARVWPLAVLTILGVMSIACPIILRGTAVSEPIDSGDTAWLLTATALVFIMTPGLSFFYGGMVSSKNIVSAIMQAFLLLGGITWLWVFVGFSLAFGDDAGSFIGNPSSHIFWRGVTEKTDGRLSPTLPLMLFALFQLKFAIITPALITGSYVERMPLKAHILYSIAFHLFIYCPVAHWTWHPNGFLRERGVLDYAGGAVVHMTAGFAALGSLFCVPRRRVRKTQPANIGFVILGAGMLWFGWFGFNSGSAIAASEGAALAFATTNTAAAAAMLAWMAIENASLGRPSAIGACLGCVVGLVAITPCAGFVTVGESIAIGALAAGVCYGSAYMMRKFPVDDTLDVFSCHGMGGAAGLLLCGVFAGKVGLVSGETSVFKYHCAAVLIVASWSFLVTVISLKLIGLITPLATTDIEEEIGLDIADYGEQAGDGDIDSLEPAAIKSTYRSVAAKELAVARYSNAGLEQSTQCV